MNLKYPLLLVALYASAVQANDLVITGVVDGSLSGGLPKAIEIFVINDIADLSSCGIGAANNGGGTDGQEITFNAGAATAGTYIYVASESAQFTSFFGFTPDYTSSSASINGDDAIELFCNGVVVDIFGDISVDGTGEPWEYKDGWAARIADTGPDDSVFQFSSWTFSGTNALDDETTNASATNPYPLKSYADEVGGGGGGGGGGGDEPTGIICGSPTPGACDVEKVADASTFDAAVYYAAVQTEVDASSPVNIIKTLLSETITSPTVLTYNQVWTALSHTDEDPADADNITLWYTGTPRAKNLNGGDAGTDWNREHSWPSSHGFGDSAFEAYSDIHHLRPSDVGVNATRGNLDFDDSDNAVTAAPGNFVDGDSFEPRNAIKGDVARMMFYMDTRYENLGDLTPDLILVDTFTDTDSNALGRLCRLWAWHVADPVDAFEEARNNAIYEFQGNRNPFIDHPEWAALFYTTDACGDSDGGGDNPATTSGVVFISEYIEGSSYNKALELYNPTASDIDLSEGNYVLSRYSNGGTSPTAINLTGIIPANGTYVVANGRANADILSKSDQISGSISHNGDDDYVLTADGTIIDAFGQVGFDPGSSYGSGDSVTANNTLIRNPDVYSGDVIVDDAFDPSIQWTGLGNNISDDLGMHTVAPRNLFISEYIEGSSFNKAIELYNPSGVSVDLEAEGYRLERFSNGGTSGSALNLTGIVAGGDVFVVANPSAIQDILDEADLTSGTISHNGDDAYVLFKGENVVDSFGRVGEDPGSRWESNGVSTANATLVRLNSIGEGDTIIDDEFLPDAQWIAFPSNTSSELGSHQFGGGGGEEPGDCCDETTLIHDVQGNGDVSPVDGDTVLIEGIVTASSSGISGFFVQEEDADSDADPSTSEGVFVFYEGDLPAVGSLVKVIGDVSEFFERTQLTATQAPEVISTGNAGPSESALSLPFTNAAQVESLEGMLVSTSQALVVTDNYTLGRFGQVTLSTERLFVPTNVFVPGSDEANNLVVTNALNRILLDDGDSTQNPEIVVFPTGGLSAFNTLRMGDTVASLTGVVDFSFGDYRVIPTQEPTFVATNPRSGEPDLNLGNLKVASLNVLNYFNNIDDSGNVCGPSASSSCRGADSDLEFERQKAKTVAAIVAMNADIVGLMEIENNGFSEGSAIADLVAGINAVMGAGSYSIVDPGATIGTDAITVAFMYKPSVVSLAGAPQILDSSNSISDEDGVLFNDGKNRPSLVQEFALLENGETLVISVNHLKSKGSSCGAGDDDTTTGQGNCNLTRTRAAQALSAFLEDQYPDTATLIMGDLNAYAKEDPISALEGAGYTNLVNYFGGAEAYSYSFRGLLGYLDHALANEEALAKVVDVTEWHINADEPISLDYNVEFKAPANVTDYYADDAYRMSDHDPVLIALQLESALVIGDWDVDGDVDINDVRGLIRAIQRRQSINVAFDLNNDGAVNILDARFMMSLCTRTRCAA
jgi:predicted extracellular nuclease/endonuclease I